MLTPIVLKGQDAVAFANSLFRPTKYELQHNAKYMGICDDVVVRRTENGFEMDVFDLDLSFLDDVE